MFLFYFFSDRGRHTICLSDWSSDVCSSDLADVGVSGTEYGAELRHRLSLRLGRVREGRGGVVVDGEHFATQLAEPARREQREIGRASGRGRVEDLVVAGV